MLVEIELTTKAKVLTVEYNKKSVNITNKLDQYVLPEVVEPKAVPKTDTAKKTPARKKTVKKSTPVIDESIIDVEPKAEAKPKASGLADAIARAKQIKQEAIVPPRQAAQNQQGVKKI